MNFNNKRTYYFQHFKRDITLSEYNKINYDLNNGY